MTDRYAVFGNPIEHSLSPEIHEHFAKHTAQDLSYTKRCVSLDVFEDVVQDFFSAEGKGLNITVPFKQRAYDLCEVLTERAEFAGAVNTLYMLDGKLHGDNTDGVGLLADIQQVLGWSLAGKRVLLLGAGGATRGVLLPLLQACPAHVVIANRTLEKAQALQQRFASRRGDVVLDVTSLQDLASHAAFDIIINATSASLTGDGLGLPASLCCSTSCCYDMAYAKEPTVFLRWAKECGAQHCADGLGMLLEQAAEAFYVWRNVRPETKLLRQQWV